MVCRKLNFLQLNSIETEAILKPPTMPNNMHLLFWSHPPLSFVTNHGLNIDLQLNFEQHNHPVTTLFSSHEHRSITLPHTLPAGCQKNWSTPSSPPDQTTAMLFFMASLRRSSEGCNIYKTLLLGSSAGH